jgi:phospholipase C
VLCGLAALCVAAEFSTAGGKRNSMRKAIVLALVTVWLTASLMDPIARAGGEPKKPAQPAAKQPDTATPIQHIVVIFNENISFDHYFGTYPNATNQSGEPMFRAATNTPSVNGLSPFLLTSNPNLLNQNNLTGAANPFRLDRSQALTADQDHNYTNEQQAFDAGLMDLFPLHVGTAGSPPNPPPSTVLTTGLTMGYFDGNTVTGLWNYAQHFAMSDNSFGTTFGPSTPGVLNLLSGQTNGTTATLNGTTDETDGGNGTLTVVGDPDPIGDVCSNATRNQVTMAGPNIGDLLNTAGVTWGWYSGGFNLSLVNPNGTTGCARSSVSPVTGLTTGDYIPHHIGFQYFTSTANPTHARPSSILNIGHTDAANHNYDVNDFFNAVSNGNFPAVNFIKPPAYQDGHAGYSDPLDEQEFLVKTLNFLEQRPEWSSTLVIIMYDDSDGWYDHQIGPIVNQSNGSADALTGPNACGNGATALPGPNGNPHALGRCGYGPRLPLLVISPFAKPNFVDHSVTDQSSIIHFIEDNWLAGQRIGSGSFDALSGTIRNMVNYKQTSDPVLILNPTTGEQVH